MDRRYGAELVHTEIHDPLVASPSLVDADLESAPEEMSKSIDLNSGQIDSIVQTVPGGANNVQGIFPIMPFQEDILLHCLMNGDHDTYVLSILLEVQSRVQLDAFSGALQNVLDRHDILRGAVFWEGLPRPAQVIYRKAFLTIEELILDPSRDPIEQMKERMALSQSWNLQRPPLVRLQIAGCLQGPKWYALLQLHHVVCDHGSLRIIIAEVVAHIENRAQQLPIPAAYRNHVEGVFADAGRHDAEAFFQLKLREIDEPTAPFGLLDVHGDGSRLEPHRQAIDPVLAQRARAMARRCGVTAAELFHASWALVVSATSGRDDVVYGTVVLMERQRSAGAQRILGMFVNTLPLRLRLRGVTVSELVEQTQRELAELLTYEQVPLSVAQRCSGIVGSAPLFSALLNYRHSPPDPQAEWGDATGIRVLASAEAWTRYPITLTVDDLGEGFVLTTQTDGRIEPHRITGYVRTAMESLMEALEQAPQTLVESLPSLPRSERLQIIESFNETQAMCSHDALIHELFEEQVERSPGAVAVVYEGQSLTYAGLNARANQLACYLRRVGIGPDQLVGICAERSLEMVVGLLGILKAGGAYVPLDPNYPPERLAYTLSDSGARVLLVQRGLEGQLPQTSALTITLDLQWLETAREDETNSSINITSTRSHHLAYVIYTSGSTGKPKGVMIEHRNVTRLFAATEAWFHFSERDVWTLFHSFAFDFSVWEIWGALLHGGRVVVVPYLKARSPGEFYKLLCEHGITVLNQTPSAFAKLIEAQAQSPSGTHSLREVVFGGEALEPRALRLWVQRNGIQSPRLVNMYGITETTVHVTYRPLTEEDIELGGSSPVGKPIPDLQAYILNNALEPVPIGVVGELYVGGAGVARGYLNRPDLTAERFVSDPFSRGQGGRLYKSGDLARWSENGTIEYLGRNDHQVKIRGFRIELGELEAQLLRHPQVREAVVLALEEAGGDRRLVAYVVPETGSAETVNAEILRTSLKEVLPEYMVPSAFVLLESLPLTPNGKLDRRALPAPGLSAYVTRQYEAPHGKIEQSLAQIWQRALQVERVGREDNFFELGGHSLLGVSLIATIAEKLSVPPPLVTIFQYPTVRLMGQLVRKLLVENGTRVEQSKAELDEAFI
jgi:amino acid adenylation domain-containing protein